jgi:outer membrane immunogenic protein
MRRIAVFLAAAIFGGGAGAAQAFDWSGFYAGVQAGYFAGSVEVYNSGYPQDTIPITGPFIGKFAGFNAQHNSIVFGIEGDINFANASGGQYINNSINYFGGGDIDMFGSIRKRVGVASDNWLFFGTVGVAFATGSYWTQYCSQPEVCDEPDYFDASLFGTVIGVGAEYAISDNVTIRKDLRLYNFGAQEVQLGVAQEDTVEFDLDAVTASVGISWHF